MAFSFNSSHMNIKTKADILKAIVKVKQGQPVEHVTNRHGQAYLAVRMAPSGLVSVTDQKGNNVKHHLIAWNGAGATRTFNHFIHNNLANFTY